MKKDADEIPNFLESMKKMSTAAWTAKIIRQILKEEFPKQKFSVKSDNFSMGNSVDIRWRDGPTVKQVDRLIGFLEGAGFDGSIDLKYGKSVYITSEGDITMGSSSGSSCSRGYADPYQNEKPIDAVEVSLADYIQSHRSYSKAFLEKFAITFQKKYGGSLMNVQGTEEWGYSLKNDEEFSRENFDRGNMAWRVLSATRETPTGKLILGGD